MSATDPAYKIDNYATRTYSYTSAEGHVGIFLKNSGTSVQTATITATTPNTYDYNYMQVGSPTADGPYNNTNLFDNMFFGVQVQNANVIFNNNTFRHVSQGIGIYNQANDVRIAGNSYTTGDHTNNRFYKNYQCGVHAEPNAPAALYTPNDLTCVNAQFTSPTYAGNHAIDLNLGTPAWHNVHEISNNYIYNYGHGINIYHQTGTTSTTTDYNGVTNINNNIIVGKPTLTSSAEETYHGISFTDGRSYSGSSGNGIVNIGENRIDGVENGIEFDSNPQGAIISEDTVNLADYGSASNPPLGMVWGIYVNTAPYLQQVVENVVGGWGYSCNTVNSSTSSAYATIGIYVNSVGTTGAHVDLSCNSVHDLVRGFNFQQANYVDWFNNQMMRDSFGMYLDGGGAKIFAQGSPCNPSDNHWDDGTTCTVCATGTCSDWPGWGFGGVFQTYVGTGAGAIWSPLYYRPTPSNYVISQNGAGSLAVAYDISTGSLIQDTCTTLADPSTCTDISGYKPGRTVANDRSDRQLYDLYPNPSDGHLVITQSVRSNVPVDVAVINVLGQTVYSGTLHFRDGKASIELSKPTPGMYLVKLTTGKKEEWNKRVIVGEY